MMNEAILFSAITAMGEFNSVCCDDLSARMKISKHHIELVIYSNLENGYKYKSITQYYRKPESLEKLTTRVKGFTDLMDELLKDQKK